MDQDDRNVSGDLIEVIARRVPQLLQLRVVVAKTNDQVGAAHSILIGNDPLPKHLLQRRDVCRLAIRRCQQVRRQSLQAAHHDMAVRIDEARDHGPAGEVDHLCLRAAQPHHVRAAADGDDAPCALGHRFGAHRGIVQRQDRPTRPDPVGRRDRLRQGAMSPCDRDGKEGGGPQQQRPAGQQNRHEPTLLFVMPDRLEMDTGIDTNTERCVITPICCNAASAVTSICLSLH